MQHRNLSALQQLQRLHASSLQQPQLLEFLSTLTALTHLDLTYDAMTAVPAAAVWQRIPALQALCLEEHVAALEPAQSVLLLQGLAAATSLTSLALEGHIVHDSIQLCAYLTGLTRLQNLEMDGAHLARRADVLHLTALTSLTGLELWDAAGVDDTAACALALRLKRLQKLNLFDCGLRSAAALPSIATLTGLTGLWLSVSSSMRLLTFRWGEMSCCCWRC
uniref:Receptor-type protein kinase n=1 Tax=Tetradesmus obliquus TaxID=3088 RepID=A0A383WIG2_TETOB|eukprot:jgi/Sobl393_1/9660/SZX77265.1